METIRYGGVTKIGMSEFGWILVISLSEEDIFKPVQRLKYIFVSIILGVVVLISLGIWFLSRQLIRPIVSLKESALDIARGNYAQRVDITSSDELGVLAEAFNQMAGTVEERQRELEQINRDLEKMVWDRTRALEQSNRELREAIDNLRSTQNQLIQSEKMASLGQLIAGIAHEIKNPLNFIYGNTEFLAEYVQKIRDYVDFAEKNIHDGAGGLARIRQYQQDHHLDFVMEDLKNLSSNIHDGADRIRSIVNDLRTFSRASSGSPTAADIRKILDMCLNLLRNQYKNRIRIHREYADIDKINVFLGKMEQVFLNLLTNAIHAIPEEGDIWIRVGDNGAALWVEIEDSGRGIPAEILSRIFEPFFTTKDVGEGTGLGLSISYTIVQQHGGSLSARNRDGGGAIFRVELPKEHPLASGEEHDG
jgi:signal transduction histidine kinase